MGERALLLPPDGMESIGPVRHEDAPDAGSISDESSVDGRDQTVSLCMGSPGKTDRIDPAIIDKIRAGHADTVPVALLQGEMGTPGDTAPIAPSLVAELVARQEIVPAVLGGSSDSGE